MGDRYQGEKISIDMSDVEGFFKNRSSRFNSLHPLAAVIYQDNNFELAAARDRHEKEALLPLLNFSGAESVLDVGCGIGRWADALYGKVSSYLGTDFTEGFIEIAKQKHADKEGFDFLWADACNLSSSGIESRFNVAIVAGLFIYLNDDDVPKVLNSIAGMMTGASKILIREPLAVEKRLTLKNIWSEELQSTYSAIYRGVDEFEEILKETLMKSGFFVSHHGPLYPDALSNRVETRQFYYILERR